MKTELSNQEKLLKVQDELISFLDYQTLGCVYTPEECDKWAKLKLEVSRLKKEVEFDLLCDPDIYEANINDHFVEEMRNMFLESELPASGLD